MSRSGHSATSLLVSSGLHFPGDAQTQFGSLLQEVGSSGSICTSNSKMYIEDFNTFFQQSEELFRKEPLRTRYQVKYKHKEGKLVLKVTDDVVCLKYKTDQQIDVKKMEKLNSLFLISMARGEHPTDEELMSTTEQLGTVATATTAATTSKGKGGGGSGGSSRNRRKG